MERRADDPKVQQLLLDALASYSDACTLPNLTPSCPFYQEKPFPTCGEECREVLSTEGYGRKVRTVEIEGLRLTGRELPIAAAGPTQVWDPVRTLFEQRELPPAQQSTSTLLLRLWVTLLRGTDSEQDTTQDALEIVSELDRRQIPADRVIRAALLPHIASQITVRVLALSIFEGEERQNFTDAEPWLDLARNYVTSLPDPSAAFEFNYSPEAASNRARGLGFMRLFERLNGALPNPEEGPNPDFTATFASHVRANPVVASVIAPDFLCRVQHWLEGRFGDGVDALVNLQTPASAVFNALSTTPPTPDPLGSWIWDRFTTVAIDEWETDSLVWEWGHLRGARNTLPLQALNERPLDADKLTDLVIDRLTRHPEKAPPTQTLKPEEFVQAAIEKLDENNPESAAAIFEALVDLDPTNGDARNNLGFCLIPVSPRRALEALESAARLPLTNPGLCQVNRSLALARMGRHHDALTVLDHLSEDAFRQVGGAYLWRPKPTADGKVLLELSREPDGLAYAQELRRGINAMPRSQAESDGDSQARRRQ